MKKSATIINGIGISGCSVLWGDATRATWIILVEGIETAPAVALAFAHEIKDGDVAVAAAISANGVEAFGVYPNTKRLTVAADRDEASKPNGAPGSRRGEQAARQFGRQNHNHVAVAIALPGTPGESIDWLDILIRNGVTAGRTGILQGTDFVPTPEEQKAERTLVGKAGTLQATAAEYPVPILDNLTLSYAVTPVGKCKLRKVSCEKDLLLIRVVTEVFLDLLGVMLRAGILIQFLKHVLYRLLVSRLSLLGQLLGRRVVALNGLLQRILGEPARFIVTFIVGHVPSLLSTGENGKPAPRLSDDGRKTGQSWSFLRTFP